MPLHCRVVCLVLNEDLKYGVFCLLPVNVKVCNEQVKGVGLVFKGAEAVLLYLLQLLSEGLRTLHLIPEYQGVCIEAYLPCKVKLVSARYRSAQQDIFLSGVVIQQGVDTGNECHEETGVFLTCQVF